MPDLRDCIRIAFACNDPDNGIFAGRISQIALPDGLMELEARSWDRPPRFRDEGRAIVLAGKRWPVQFVKTWYGNWCRNAYWLTEPDARAFLIWLHGRKLFDCSCGEQRLFNIWRLDAPLDLDPNGLGRLLLKSMLAERRA
jgi:hypothetical protein